MWSNLCVPLTVRLSMSLRHFTDVRRYVDGGMHQTNHAYVDVRHHADGQVRALLALKHLRVIDSWRVLSLR